MIGEDVRGGVAIGMLLGLDEGRPLVVFPGNPSAQAVPARSLVRFDLGDIGAELAILFEDGDPTRPLVIGRIVGDRPPGPVAAVDGEPLRITARQRIELRCGKASIVMEADGHITIRGTYLVSHASAANRIRGGSINLN
ncbi:DUF6484 domain-containing protein [Paracoccus sp. P2]|uniref:DUF6484 domain-containing protein n=1 Tax=Paracoccus pantotrophus TaxID=82367 RepID=A0A7H9BX75_PARPN|nr:DUF6484 domain-containing protein [Paracoccus pantotrophus]MDF3854696.1 DUF6484 domain-containing protein [Paracoccus pantotrophus]QLH15742.1 hypothetical protein HYQ43_16460 [Paracoccus pantotrophus]RDD95935.1 hypothetical protein DTW92_15125 [Paracoccus pantotrophus]RNI19760.1 hypothetical protein EB844_02820 [Paracoccus pantotrophus]WGR63943.1 hypothetical protein E3U24_00850 [Paracoccus pantotrophus]